MMVLSNAQKARVLSLEINLVTYQDALTKIVELAKGRGSSYVCFANVHMTVEAYWDVEFANKVNLASLVLADGVPIAKSLKLLYGFGQDRIAGMDVLPELIRLADLNNLKVFFFGSSVEQLARIKNRIVSDFPKLKIVGLLSPPFKATLSNENYVNQINSSGANMVFVALGCPKQEKWMAENYAKINAPLLGVGGAFSVYSGYSKRAPFWMQRLSLEWLYRLIQEPQRMWKRYLITNTIFLLLIVRQFILSLLKK